MKFSHLSALLTSLLHAFGETQEGMETVWQEDFAGRHALSTAFFDRGHRIICRDVKYARRNDILSTAGFLVILQCLRSMASGALYWSAPPCSSWVFFSRGSTGRSRALPRGCRRHKKVREQNRLVRRLIYLLQYLNQKGVLWVVEQPASSVLWYYGPMRRFLRKSKAIEIRVPLGQYGASSEHLVRRVFVSWFRIYL